MTDGIVPAEQRQDVMAQEFLDNGTGRDPARTPLHWHTGANSGFTAHGSTPWLPLADNYQTVNVATQKGEPTSTLNFYQTLIALRQRLPALQHGSFAIVENTPEDILIYLRQYNEQRLLIIINFAATEFTLDLSHLAQRAVLQLSSLFTPKAGINIERITVDAHESLLLQLD